MASFRENGRREGSKRRSGDPRRVRQGLPGLEPLENRRLLSTSPPGGTLGGIWHATTNNPYDIKNGPLANLGQDLIHIYQQYVGYEQAGAKGTFTPSLAKSVNFYGGTNVEIDAYYLGDQASYVRAMQGLGMFVVATNTSHNLVEGYIPIASLPQVAGEGQTENAAPVYTAKAFVGLAQNQGDITLGANVARQTFGVDGTGVPIGVISTSFSHNGTGLAGSVASGDLPSNVQIIDDSSLLTDDEGRGMAENIHDIAPGSPLSFATGVNGQAQFAQNIAALASQAKAKVIVDDLGIANEPYFQEGVIGQAIDTYVAGGGIYLSAAGNEADSGYLSNFRAATGTAGSVGAGTYQNFDGTGASTAVTLGINLYTPGTGIILQYDQPFDKVGGGVTTDLDLYLLDQSGNVVASSTTNNVATNQPIEGFLTDNAGKPIQPGLYQVAVKLVSGPAPGHMVLYSTGDGGFSVDRKFGSAGATSYPSTFGHNSIANTISVGAVPFWGAPPYTTPTTIYNEPFSSTGPRLIDFNPDGTPTAPQVLLKPDLSAPDGGVTSFFPTGGGQHVDTTNPFFPTSAFPPYPGSPQTVQGEPVTATNLNPGTLPDFFGTSSASPNLAAVIALMEQSTPGITRAGILSALDSTATPLNGAAKGVWNAQGGFGLANAPMALAAASTLRVQFISPGAGQTVAIAPQYIQVQFTKPVNVNTIAPGALQVIAPNGATVVVGKPYGVDDPNFPTFVRFPITIVPAPGKIANGFYQTLLFAGTVTSQTGLPLTQGVADGFTLAQTSGPQVTNVSYVGRIVQITFSEPVNPATITPNNVFLFRTGGLNNAPFGPSGIIVSQLNGASLTYNPANFTATIDLSGVPQSSLPTDNYGLVVTTGVTDGVGNPLNGQFSGVFPSGTSPAALNGSNFFQYLPDVVLQPPTVSYLSLTQQSDSGIQGDGNTNINTPSFIGQVTARFPAALAGLTVYAEFNGISHPGVARGGLDLGVGANGQGFVGHFDVQVVTNALGQFLINYPAGVAPLPEGQNQLRVVVVGQSNVPPFPGVASATTTAFRIDNTLPYVGTPTGAQATSIPENAQINSLPNLSISVIDPVNPTTLGDPFAVDPRLNIPALNPIQANNVSNYRLYLLVNGTAIDESSFISTATFTSTSTRTLSSDPFTGRIDLTFAPGLPTGRYSFFIISSGVGPGGISDAAGNAFGGFQSTASTGTPFDFQLDFNLQPTPTYITGYGAYAADPTSPVGFVQTDVRANYEIPVPGTLPRAPAPPTMFTLDFSNSLNPYVNYNNAVQLVRSANSLTSKPDGDFGDLGITNTTGYTRVPGVNVTLANSVPGAVFGQYGYNNRLVITLPAGSTLPADYYRLYLPNNGPSSITDIFGNQLDGEFLGYKNANGVYVDQLTNGQLRGNGALPDLTGDGTPGGAFVTGFVVVPNGNIIYARADALFNPQVPSQIPNGSVARPYPVLAPEAVANNINGGDLNSIVNSGSNFSSIYDRSGDGQFEPSAFFAAQQRVQATGGPAVIIAESSIPTRDPITGALIQKPFVLQAPSGSDPVANDGSASVPALTTLVFQPDTILKMQNASLFVQNQGSALQIAGGANAFQTVNVTSYKDSTIGGVTNGDPTTVGSPGDYGGIVFRNFSQAAIPGSTTPRSTLFPGQIDNGDNLNPNDPKYYQRLKGPFTDPANPASQLDAVSGADDVMSYVAFLTERFAGGAVPQTNGVRYDGITLYNSRPGIVNSSVTDTNGPNGSAQAGISVNVDSLRVDDIAQGPLIRNDVFLRNGLNGIYIRAEVGSGLAQSTNSIAYPSNPTANGGAINYILNSPYPYLLTSRLDVGDVFQEETGGQGTATDRLYVSPGMILKFEHGAALVVRPGASLNVGDTTYIKQYDANNLVGPTESALLANGQVNPLAGQKTPGFVPNSAGLAQVIFTSLNDDAATTAFFDPITQTTTTIVSALPAVPGGSGVLQPIPGNVPDAARWGGIAINEDAVAVINSTIFRYGGGAVNTAAGTGAQHVLEVGGGPVGARISVTNNTFTDNLDVPINLQPDSLLAGDPQRPLNSGNPFIHGNVFVNNGVNGVGVQGGTGGVNTSNLDHDSVWTGTDFTYILRDTIVLAGRVPQVPNAIALQPIPKAAVTLTLQSTLPGTILADGSTVASPGVPLVVKLLGGIANETPGMNPAPAIPNSYAGGAGFLVGVDNGVDPPADRLVDPGAFSQLRIVGIGANQTTGQTRVPVIITSIHDSTVGTTVNNVVMNQAIPGDGTAPKAGDGGVIYFGGNALTTYNLQDPRSGSLIDNADIRYITRVEQQGGGVIYTFDLTNQGSFAPGPDQGYGTKLGYALGTTIPYADQYNQAKQLTISNSNLSTFSDAGFIAHPGYLTLGVEGNYLIPNSPFIYRVANYLGEATHTYFVNDTISNMPIGAEIISETADNASTPSPAMAVFLNNTFYNDAVGIHTIGAVANNVNDFSHVAFLAMDNIFSNITGNAVQADNQSYGSDLQYNLFYQIGGANAVGVPNDQPILGNPAFRNAAAGNFFLLPTSAAIDVARSELGPSIFGDMLYPTATINPANLNAIPIRNVFNDPNNLNGPAGDVNPAGGLLIGAPYPVDIVTLPGEPVKERGFPDQFIPVLQTAPNGTAGTSTNPATFVYAALSGERDQSGNLRVKDPNSPNVGFGSRPFFDLGAFEYIIQNPPIVTGVVANANGTVAGLYNPGGIAGINQAPQTIQVGFNERLNPNTLNGMSVILQASGGDGIFGNGNSPADRTINLAGLLSFDPNTNVLTINTSGILNNPATLNDEYRLTLKGTGSNVIRDPSGLALDGYTANDTLPLPSGSDMFPGSDFVVTFTISTHSPSIVGGSFKLAPASDSSGGRNITKINTPTFIGSITDMFPPINAVAGQSVHIDISSQGDGVFDILDAGVGTTDAAGNFSITLTKPIPDTPHTVGNDGIQGDAGGVYAIARVRVINQAGNASSQVTDPLSSYLAKGAATFLQVDTKLPQISAFSPLANTVATVNANGEVTVSVTFTKNINGSTLNPGSIQVFRSGGTGNFGGAGVVAVPIDQGSFTVQYLGDATGSERVTFGLQGPLPNDEYEIILKGTGTTPITDIPGNPLSGAFVGSFPTGGASNQGSDFVNLPFTVFQPGQSRLLYVEAPVAGLIGTGTLGTRSNPYPTIAAAMAKALIGDDVLVLPGTYFEDVVVKPGVRLLSADVTSTDTAYLPGIPNQTLIYGILAGLPQSGTNFGSSNITTVSINGSIFGVPTEVSGFSIISPLVGDPSLGFIDPTTVAISASNSNALIDRNNIINAGVGVMLTTTGAGAPTSEVFDNVIAGNIIGVGITDSSSTSSITGPFLIVNNTIADNTIGLINGSSTPGVLQAFVLNNIFYSNHDLTSARAGTGIQSNTANTLGVGFNLFYNNGASSFVPSSNAVGVFGQFNPAALTTRQDALGNFLGDPAFVAPRDPRPNGDTPPVFFLNGNYDLSARSAAINAANPQAAPATDFLYRSPVRVVGKGFPNTGPASVGAYYYLGTGGPSPGGGSGGGSGGNPLPGGGPIVTPGSGGGTNNPPKINPIAGLSVTANAGGAVVGGGLPIGTRQFDVVNTSLSTDGTSHASGIPGVLAWEAAPTFIDINFSHNLNPTSVSPNDLILSGNGLDPLNPARATSLAWIDGHAVRFFLTGGFANGGTVSLSIPQGSLLDSSGAPLLGYNDAFTIISGGTSNAAPVVPPVAVPGVAALAQPTAVAGPVSMAATVVANPAKHNATQVAHAAKTDAKHKSVKVVNHASSAKHPKGPSVKKAR